MACNARALPLASEFLCLNLISKPKELQIGLDCNLMCVYIILECVTFEFENCLSSDCIHMGIWADIYSLVCEFLALILL